MARRLLALLIAFAIAVALPTLGGAAASAGMAMSSDCACPDPEQDCGDHGKLGCATAISCAAKCGPGTPMIGAATEAPVARPSGMSHARAASPLPASAIAAPPFRPPAAPILT